MDSHSISHQTILSRTAALRLSRVQLLFEIVSKRIGSSCSVDLFRGAIVHVIQSESRGIAFSGLHGSMHGVGKSGIWKNPSMVSASNNDRKTSALDRYTDAQVHRIVRVGQPCSAQTLDPSDHAMQCNTMHEITSERATEGLESCQIAEAICKALEDDASDVRNSNQLTLLLDNGAIVKVKSFVK